MYKFYYDSDTINVFVQLTFIWSLFVLCVKIKIIYDMNKFKHKKTDLKMGKHSINIGAFLILQTHINVRQSNQMIV